LKTETQNLIVVILGVYANISVIGILILSFFITNNNELIFALVAVPTGAVGILGGFVAGKSVAEHIDTTPLEPVEVTPEEVVEVPEEDDDDDDVVIVRREA